MSEFDFVDHYEDQEESANLLPNNEAESAIKKKIPHQAQSIVLLLVLAEADARSPRLS